RFTHHASRITHHASRFTFHVSRITFHASRFTIPRMKICVIFNPTARGEKAKHFQAHLASLSSQCLLKPTSGPGAGRALAGEAVEQGFGTIVAAGGDGTVNEVLNGIGDAADGFQRARLAVLPLGTVNVFAKELRIPSGLPAAWKLVREGSEARIDLAEA